MKTERLSFLQDQEWQREKARELGPSEQEVFLVMHQRKLQRQLNGPQRGKSRFGLISLIVFLAILYGTAAYSSGKSDDIFTLDLWQVFFIGLWALCSVVITSVFAKSRLIELLNWTFIYWPLIAVLTSLLFTGTRSPFQSDNWVWVSFVAVEVLTVAVWAVIFCISPAFVSSSFFADNIGAGYYWNIHLVTEWTMTYRDSKFAWWKPRRTCKYQGQVNTQGLPHGKGHWSDDSYYGEVLAGHWNEGVPVAPFLSRQYGTGDTFRAVSIVYFMATDDGFESTKLVPTNEQAPRCGVASVECSVQGSFYSQLPAATSVFGPSKVEQEASLADCLSRVLRLESQNCSEAAVHIYASSPWCIHVQGHVFESTGLGFSQDTHQIIVDVTAPDQSHSPECSISRFMPRASTSAKDEKVFVNDIRLLERSDEANIPLADGDYDKERKTRECLQERSGAAAPRLEVQNWTKTPHRDALIYIPGFNSCLKHSLECLGQFLAMTKLSQEIYPVCFAYPSGQVVSYRLASAASASKRNRQLFLEMIHGLKAAGIRNLHLMSHSLGVQTLLGVFEDDADGNRSPVSKSFHLDSDFGTDETAADEDSSLLLCKSVTMLNPDFPLDAFIDHAFESVRRVCSHITIVGDRGDQALFYSGMVNGACEGLGYEQPRVLNRRSCHASEIEDRGFRFRRVVGRCIDSICMKAPISDEECSMSVDARLVFDEVPPVILSSNEEEPVSKAWLDVDVIDTTSLDTNIQNLRHSAFNVNPILLKDLEELILTGRRAAKRSTLLHREGNVFSYCHAPAFVAL